MKWLISSGVVLLSLFLLTSCEDKTSEDLQNNLQVTGDMLTGQVYFWDVYTNLDKVARDSNLLNTGNARIDSAYCQLLPDDGGIQLDYGKTEVLCPDGRTRRGRVLLELFGPYLGDTLEGMISFDDYYVDGHMLSGIMHISGTSLASNNNRVKVQVKEGILAKGEEQLIWASTYQLHWYEGMETPFNTEDDHCALLSGSSIEGTATNLIGFTAEVLEDSLTWNRSCKYLTSGIMQVSLPALEYDEGFVDFGKGDCDARADLEYAGSIIPFYFE